jgi:hypothetical protein
MMVGDVDLRAKRVWVRQPVVEVEGRLVRNATPKGGRSRVVVGPQLAQLLREHLMRSGMPAADAPLLTGAMGNGIRWNNYLFGFKTIPSAEGVLESFARVVSLAIPVGSVCLRSNSRSRRTRWREDPSFEGLGVEGPREQEALGLGDLVSS